MMRSTLAATLVTASLISGGAAAAYTPPTPTENAESASMPASDTGDANGELANTGPNNMMLALWAGSAMLVLGAAATGLTVVRRRTNTAIR